MKYFKGICLISFAFLSVSSAVAEIAVFGEPLKDQYSLNGDEFDFKWFYKTGEKASSHSVTCDMGKAILITDEREGDWYRNQPIYGLTL
ncbi:hypothetical protein [Shewanella japonica]|uniref:hypothetical protein n=1 Tax=Shewanella japonica TaxID=93973 RepID=UPI000E76DBCB|nr:hypothetical protein [Shewanella japonica]